MADAAPANASNPSTTNSTQLAETSITEFIVQTNTPTPTPSSNINNSTLFIVFGSIAALIFITTLLFLLHSNFKKKISKSKKKVTNLENPFLFHSSSTQSSFNRKNDYQSDLNKRNIIEKEPVRNSTGSTNTVTSIIQPSLRNESVGLPERRPISQEMIANYDKTFFTPQPASPPSTMELNSKLRTEPDSFEVDDKFMHSVEMDFEKSGKLMSLYDAYGSSLSSKSEDNLIANESSANLPGIFVIPSTPSPPESFLKSGGLESKYLPSSTLKYESDYEIEEEVNEAGSFTSSSSSEVVMPNEIEKSTEKISQSFGIENAFGSYTARLDENTFSDSPTASLTQISGLISDSLRIGDSSLEYKCYVAYRAKQRKELTLNVGDIISVMNIHENDMAYGANNATGMVGLFPIACLINLEQ
ncbi:hypothetical protein HK099_003629 [Clydaea vesicula]|uniref:SH3 domain-containing protein n=1 Tax=Clydaea vesicula TaxID=447962 RepID=A0AAD5U787_9FUNG|nr:hypothetical protein HK099_003629 [Clydaea vesicula]